MSTQPLDSKLRAGEATLLSISPNSADHAFFQALLEGLRWHVETARSYSEGIDRLQMARPAVVVCEQELPDGGWRDVLENLQKRGDAPPLVVTSRLADDSLWAEVLNLGGYDLLPKPLERREAERVVVEQLCRAPMGG
jgi:CheY-like chemotaxis protein